MEESLTQYSVTKRDLAKRRNLRIATWASPFVLAGIPLITAMVSLLLFAFTPPTAAIVLFLGLILTAVGFLGGIGLAGYFHHRRTTWTKQLKERIAADGISASEIDWFKKELTSAERRSLKSISDRDPLLADTFRDALASRLTATRIVRSSRHELQLMKRRVSKLQQNRAAPELLNEVAGNISKIESVKREASALLSEAESRLQMIEAAAVRTGSLADSELALKKLTMRTKQLPVELEHAKLTEDIRRELEQDDKDGEKKTERPFERMN